VLYSLLWLRQLICRGLLVSHLSCTSVRILMAESVELEVEIDITVDEPVNKLPKLVLGTDR
jgi:hypothetical protein